MSDYKAAEGESSVTDGRTDLEQRDVRALTEYMTTLSLGGDVYSVTTQSGSEYRVDALEGRCTCPDKQHNLEDGELCKHERRVRFATGEWAVPAWADRSAIDPQIGEHVSGTVQVAASDGGDLLAVDPESDQERPDDCDCSPRVEDLPCWPCYRDGFEEPSQNTEEDD